MARDRQGRIHIGKAQKQFLLGDPDIDGDKAQEKQPRGGVPYLPGLGALCGGVGNVQV